MRTTILVPAAALAAMGFAPLAAPPAHAIPSCAEQLQELAARTGTTVDPAIMAQCQAHMAAQGAQPAHQPPPQAPPTSTSGAVWSKCSTRDQRDMWVSGCSVRGRCADRRRPLPRRAPTGRTTPRSTGHASTCSATPASTSICGIASRRASVYTTNSGHTRLPSHRHRSGGHLEGWCAS
jgi:hypothetical protein